MHKMGKNMKISLLTLYIHAKIMNAIRWNLFLEEIKEVTQSHLGKQLLQLLGIV